MDGHTSAVYSVCFSPDGTILVSSSGDYSILLWGLKKLDRKEILDGHTSTVYSVCFSPDSNTLLSGSNDKSIRLWDMSTQYATHLIVLY